jgi:hypothetical protein
MQNSRQPLHAPTTQSQRSDAVSDSHENPPFFNFSDQASKVENCPEGYPRLAAMLDCDENFMIYRRFGFLQTRLLLNKQDELRELENDLDCVDKFDVERNPMGLRSRELDAATNDRRKKLLYQIEEKFHDYGTGNASSSFMQFFFFFFFGVLMTRAARLLADAHTITGYRRPSKRDYRSIRNYFKKTAPLCALEVYIDRKEDLITLKHGRDIAWMEVVVDKIVAKFPSGILQVRRAPPPSLQ